MEKEATREEDYNRQIMMPSCCGLTLMSATIDGKQLKNAKAALIAMS